jgi:hypothetical protein
MRYDRPMIPPPRPARTLARLTCCAAASLALLSCQHGQKKSADTSSPRKLESRLLHPDMKKSNPFDKEFNTASASNRGSTKYFGGKGFKTKDVGGIKNFGGVKSYHTGEFAQAGKANRMGAQASRFGKQDSRMGGQTFATKDSRLGQQAAHQDGQTFHGSNDVFKTGDFQPASKSIKDNKRIFFERGETDNTKNADAYSEDQVKRILGR